jgi:hypothetical protein
VSSRIMPIIIILFSIASSSAFAADSATSFSPLAHQTYHGRIQLAQSSCTPTEIDKACSWLRRCCDSRGAIDRTCFYRNPRDLSCQEQEVQCRSWHCCEADCADCATVLSPRWPYKNLTGPGSAFRDSCKAYRSYFPD